MSVSRVIEIVRGDITEQDVEKLKPLNMAPKDHKNHRKGRRKQKPKRPP